MASRRTHLAPTSHPGNSRFTRFTGAAAAVALIVTSLPVITNPAPVSAQQACATINGSVYHDLNDNGIRQPGEPSIGNVPMELRRADGTSVATTTAAADGSYAFSVVSGSTAATQTTTVRAVFPATTTDWTMEKTLPQFDPALGTLKAVRITAAGSITSALKAESLDFDTATLTARVSGTLTVEMPGKKLAVQPVVEGGTFQAAAYDGATDFTGPSGHNFGSTTASDSATETIADAASLQAYAGTGTVKATAQVLASSRTTGGGNVVTEVATTAGAEVTVVYEYNPPTCLPPGQYVVCEAQQPAGFADGLETAGNVTPIPNTKGTDCININFTGSTSSQNNFGELQSSLHGCVYVDADDDGVRDAGEAPIPGVLITLGGQQGATTTTATDGCYVFPSLPPGTYTLTETQPNGYRDCKDTIGTQGGTTANDRFTEIVLAGGVNGRENNFGECGGGTATQTVLADPPPATTTPSGGGSTTSQQPSPTPAGPQATPTPRPGVPSAGTGMFSLAPDLPLIIVGFAVFAASGWLAFLGIGRKVSPLRVYADRPRRRKRRDL